MAAGPGAVMVVRGGRRYRRTGDSLERTSHVQSSSSPRAELHPIPNPPSIHRDIHSAEMISPAVITEDNRPFQRYKPLPAIGADPHYSHEDKANAVVLVCVRLPDGSRAQVTSPTSSPLSSLVASALRATSSELLTDEHQRWTLCTSEVPKRELSDLSLSLKETGITRPCMLHLALHDPP